MLQLPVGDGRESPSCQLLGLQIHKGGDAEKEATENTQDYNAKVFSNLATPDVPLHQHEQHAGQSGGAPNVNSLPLDNSMLRTVAAVQQFMTEFNGAMSEEENIVEITKIV
jgi:hypothetical protein